MTIDRTLHTWPGIELKEVPVGQWVETLSPEPDPGWQYVDLAGHGHFYECRPGSDTIYPTLRWQTEPCTMGHGEDCDSEGHWECIHCGERVAPRTRTAGPIFVPGPSKFTLTTTRGNVLMRYAGFGPTEMDELIETIHKVIAARLHDFRTEVVIGR